MGAAVGVVLDDVRAVVGLRVVDVEQAVGVDGQVDGFRCGLEGAEADRPVVAAVVGQDGGLPALGVDVGDHVVEFVAVLLGGLAAVVDAGVRGQPEAGQGLRVEVDVAGRGPLQEALREQQAHSAESPDRLTEFDDPTYPALSKAASHVVAGTFEERFEFALNRQVVALRAELDRTRDTPG
ncbi:hypothetical protein [Streptomyces sp. NPDC054765]